MAEDEQNFQNEEEMSVEELVEENNILLNTLIDYLIEKKVVDEEEFLEKLNSISDEAHQALEGSEEEPEDSSEDSEEKKE